MGILHLALLHMLLAAQGSHGEQYDQASLADHAHWCVHGDPRIRRITADGMDRATPHPVRHRHFREQTAFSGDRSTTSVMTYDDCEQPLRLRFSTVDLAVPGRYCSRVGDVVPDFIGGLAECTAQDILTTQKASVITDRILPRLQSFASGMLGVRRQFSSTFPLRPLSASVCGFFTAPATLLRNGVDADLLILVSAAPYVAGGVRAWSITCQYDDGLPVVAGINFVPAFIPTTDQPSAIDQFFKVSLHELIHCLGFSPTVFLGGSGHPIEEHIVVAPNPRLGGNASVTYLASPAAQKHIQNHFACSSAAGLELADGTHQTARIVPDELMTPNGGEYYLTNATLAVLHDLGYAVNVSFAMPWRWGASSGCALLERPCAGLLGGGDLARYFCASECNTSCYLSAQCPHNRQALAYCQTSALYEGCAMVRALDGRNCPVGQRCLVTDLVAACRTVTCPDGATAMTVALDNATVECEISSTAAEEPICPNDGQNYCLDDNALLGQLTFPEINLSCLGLQDSSSGPSAETPPASAPPGTLLSVASGDITIWTAGAPSLELGGSALARALSNASSAVLDALTDDLEYITQGRVLVLRAALVSSSTQSPWTVAARFSYWTAAAAATPEAFFVATANPLWSVGLSLPNFCRSAQQVVKTAVTADGPWSFDCVLTTITTSSASKPASLPLVRGLAVAAVLYLLCYVTPA